MMAETDSEGVGKEPVVALSRSLILLVNPAPHSKIALRKINHLGPSTWARDPPKMAYSWQV